MQESDSPRWVTAWATAPQRNTVETVSFDDQTLRQIVHVGVGGEKLRVRLSNVYGPEAITVSRASVGLVRRNSTLVPASVHPLTFDATADVTLAVGAETVSDPVALRIDDDSRLAVSLYFDKKVVPAGWHRRSFERSWVIDGDATTQARVKSRQVTTAWHWLSGIDVQTSRTQGAIVAIGDSITNGYELALGKNQSWPSVLQRRLTDTATAELRYSVLNLGIGGNRLLHDSDELGFGHGLLTRLQRDAFSLHGVSQMILLIGVNDIGIPVTPPEELSLSETIRGQVVTAEQLIDGVKALVARADEKGIRVVGATILPYAGAAYFTDSGERTRQRFNDWIRQSEHFDYVIDFDAMLRDPDRPVRLLPAYDGGDHLHPNAKGHRAMALGIDLGALLNVR